MRSVFLACLLLLSACGQKGPLYLPLPGESAPPAERCQTCPPQQAPAPEEQPAHDDEENPNASPEESTQ